MKKYIVLVASVLLMFLLGACSQSTAEDPAPPADSTTADPLNMVLLIGGLGDMSFADSAYSGIEAAKNQFQDAIQADVIEFGYDYSVVENYLLDAADQYDIVIMPSQFVEAVADHAPSYPDVKFWLYGTSFPFEEGDYDNVYAMNYRSNEGSFLAGFLAGSSEGAHTLGFLGGMDNNVINDFWYGYVQGAKEANEDIQVITNYVGSFDDTARGKELSLAMYQAGASTIFNVAGPVGLGLAEAAVEVDQDVDMIGVDSDQAQVFEAEGRKDLAQVVSTSVLTNIGPTLLRAIELEIAGTLPYGQVESLGLAEGAVGIATNDYYEATYSPEQKQAVEDIAEQIINGDIVVKSVYDPSVDIDPIRDAVAP